MGERALTAPLRGPLADRGIAVAEGRGGQECPQVMVEVRGARPGYDLTISDVEGRIARKVVDRAETAAMVIESWARSDLSATLMPSGGAAPSTGRSTAELVMVSASSPTAPAPLGLQVAGESTIAEDRSLWMGGSAGVCLPLAFTCVGALGRVGQALRAAGPARSLPPARRLELLLMAQVPLRLGALWLAPELAVGVARMDRTSTVPLPVGLNTDFGRPSGRGGDGRGRQRDGEGRSSGERGNPGDEGHGHNQELAALTTGPQPPGARLHHSDSRLMASTGLTVGWPLSRALSLAFTMSVGWPGYARGGLGLAYGRRPARSPGDPAGLAP